MVDDGSTPIILLAHGSPDPDWRRPIEQVRDRLRTLVPGRTIEIAFLERAEPSLPKLVDALARRGHRHAVVLAAFLSGGGNHLKKHVPELVSATAARHPGMKLRLVPGALGAEPEVVEAIARAAVRLTGTGDGVLR